MLMNSYLSQKIAEIKPRDINLDAEILGQKITLSTGFMKKNLK